MAKPSGIKPYTGSNRCGSPSLQSLEAALAELSAEQLEAAAAELSAGQSRGEKVWRLPKIRSSTSSPDAMYTDSPGSSRTASVSPPPLSRATSTASVSSPSASRTASGAGGIKDSSARYDWACLRACVLARSDRHRMYVCCDCAVLKPWQPQPPLQSIFARQSDQAPRHGASACPPS
jgi:hypothetical protein